MSTRLVIDEQSQLQEIRQSASPKMPQSIRIIARILSWIFHPVFIPVYVVYFMVYVHPYLFAGFAPFDKTRTIIMSFVAYTFFPVITVLLLKGLKFISSIQLKTQKDRIIPLVACGIWYFWIWYVWHNLSDYPRETRLFALAIWIASWLALMANIIMKISLHAIAAGVALTFIVLLGISQDLNFTIYISVALFATGLICSARFADSDHSPGEIYLGLTIGVLTQCIIWWIG